MDSRKLMAWCLGWGCWIVNALAHADVWIVTKAPSGSPNEFAEIQPAIDAASDGDVILLRNGQYRSFAIDGKSLTLLGDFAQSYAKVVQDEATAAQGYPERSIVKNLRSDQSCTIRALTIEGLELRDNAGAIWLEGNQIEKTAPACSIEHCARVVLSRMKIFGESAEFDPSGNLLAGASPALVIRASEVAVKEGTLRGGFGSAAFVTTHGVLLPATPGAPAIVMHGGTLLARNAMMFGGDGGAGFQLTSSTVCASGADGAVAFDLDSAVVKLLSCPIFGGKGGAAPLGGSSCVAGSTAAPTQVTGGSLNTGTAVSHSIYADSPMREGQKAFVFLTGKPGESVVVLAGTRLSVGPVVGGGALSMLGPNASVAGVFAIPQTSGFLAVFSTPLVLPPAVDSVELFLEAGFCDAMGCDVVFGSALTIVDRRISPPLRMNLPGPAGN